MTAGQTFAQNYEYGPDFCEFRVAFPEEPAPTKRCDNNGGRCYDLVSYTKVFDLSSTVNFRVICNPADKETIDFYTEDVMKRTLQAMTKRSLVDTFDTNYREEEDYKQAGLVGEGKISQGASSVYLAQLWVGKHSIFSIEGELIGEQHKDADKLFRDILVSVRAKNDTREESSEKIENHKGEKTDESEPEKSGE